MAKCVLPVLVGPRTATRRGAERSMAMATKVRSPPPQGKGHGGASGHPALFFQRPAAFGPILGNSRQTCVGLDRSFLLRLGRDGARCGQAWFDALARSP